MKAWCAISVGNDRQYGGNQGYDDVPASLYRYDSNVANHKRIQAGDLLIVRERKFALGIATVVKVSHQPGSKTYQSCPSCSSRDIKQRKTLSPPWRCSGCGLEFSQPNQASERVELYEALYGETYVSLSKNIAVSTLKSIMPRPNDQHSIEEIDLSKLEGLLEQVHPLGMEVVRRAAMAQRLTPEAADEDDSPSGYVPSSADQSDKVLRSIRARRGQGRFRKALIRRYGNRCMVTGCEILDLLEAAHIVPYKTLSEHHPTNGLLLRSDIHTLFDLHLMVIDPETLKVSFDPKVRSAGYDKYQGSCVAVGKHEPSKVALRARLKAIREITTGSQSVGLQIAPSLA